MSTVTLVACSKSKRSTHNPAKELYSGDLFRLSRKFAEHHSPDRWFILSGKHGIISPDLPLSPYNLSLCDEPVQTRRRWAAEVAPYLGEYLRDVKCNVLWVLAGIRYREFLLPLLQDYIDERCFRIPLSGFGIGQQKQWLKQALEKEGLQ